MPTFTIHGENRLGDTLDQTTDDIAEAVHATLHMLESPLSEFTRTWTVLDEDGFDVTPVMGRMLRFPVLINEENIETIYTLVATDYKAQVARIAKGMAAHAATHDHDDGAVADFNKLLDSEEDFEAALDALLKGDSPPSE